ncbi:hypothetical protein J6590_107951, partial [Homalodisca vitripennis]
MAAWSQGLLLEAGGGLSAAVSIPALDVFYGIFVYTCDFRTTTNGRAGGLLARKGLLSGHPSKQQPRLTLLDL